MFLKKLDFISPEITLYYRGSENHSSIISGILSILMGIFIVFLIGYLSIDVFAKKNPTSFYFTKFIEEIEDYPLNSSAMLHYVSLKKLYLRLNLTSSLIISKTLFICFSIFLKFFFD